MTKVLIFSVLLLTWGIFIHKLNNKYHKCRVNQQVQYYEIFL